MIPTGHLLGAAVRTGGQFTARCACGTDVWGVSLPQVWEAHDRHLGVVFETRHAALEARHREDQAVIRRQAEALEVQARDLARLRAAVQRVREERDHLTGIVAATMKAGGDE